MAVGGSGFMLGPPPVGEKARELLPMNDDIERRYYLDFAAAFVRGRLARVPPFNPADLVRHGLEQGLRLHKFKRGDQLPRVRKVLGVLRGLGPIDLLDVGSGR